MGIEGHPPLPAEEKQQCLMLTEQIGIYELPGFVLKPYTNEMVFTLLKALEHLGQGVKLCTMLMLAQVIQQFEVAVTLLRETVTPKMI